MELFFVASKLNKEQKLAVLNKASGKLDTLKFFLQFSWEIKAMDNKRYILISKDVAEIGRMLGSWLKNTEKQTLPK